MSKWVRMESTSALRVWGVLLKKAFKSKYSGKSYVGGIKPENFDSMSSCYAISDVKGDEYIGAVIGRNGQQ